MKMGNTSLKMRSRNRNTWNKKPLVAAFPLFLGMASGMFAQTHGPDDGYIPQAAQQGSPAGSYSLTDLFDLNYLNGRPNISIPLFEVAGRGTVKLPVKAVLNTNWELVYTPITNNNSQCSAYDPSCHLPQPQSTQQDLYFTVPSVIAKYADNVIPNIFGVNTFFHRARGQDLLRPAGINQLSPRAGGDVPWRRGQ